MRPIIGTALSLTAALASGALGANLPDAADHHRKSVPGGLARRHHRADCGGADESLAWAGTRH